MINYLSLFSGIGGGDLAMQHLLGFRCVGYVENNEYCQKVIGQRITDGVMDRAPIFEDITAFFNQYAGDFAGLVDGVTAGPPCQPFSVAGRKRDEHDERNLWPITFETVGRIKPRWCFYENSPRLRTIPYFHTILREISRGGFDAKWRNLSAAQCGAPYRRNRLWILSYTREFGRNMRINIKREYSDLYNENRDAKKDVESRKERGRRSTTIIETFSDIDSIGLQAGTDGMGRETGTDIDRGTAWAELEREESAYYDIIHGDHSGFSPSHDGGERSKADKVQRLTWWDTPPAWVRLVSGATDRVERIKSLGNCQVPVVAATAFRLLSR
jgi:DNA (cytosine-5)-methyltransferase 1